MKKNLYDGIKVLDLTNNFAGPTVSALLADFGAEVIHVERPVLGDDVRYFPPMIDGVSVSHLSGNRGKKSLVLDLKDPRAIDVIKKLAMDSDILVESYRPGVMDRLGLGYQSIKEINPEIIYCSVSAYGQTGPYAQRPGYDVIAQAVSGIMDMSGDPNGPPTKIGVAIGDWIGGLTGFGMIGHALYYRTCTGLGQHIDISLARILAWASSRYDFPYTGIMETRTGNHHATLAPYGIFSGNHGESIIIAALSQNTWKTLCNTMGKPEYAQDPRFVTNDKRVENLPEIIEFIESWLKGFEHISDAEKIMMDAGVPCAKIYTQKDCFNDPHFNECGWIIQIPASDDVKSISARYTAADPFEFSEVKPEYRKAPVLGEHNHEILERLGYTSQEVDDMQREWANRVKG